MANVFYPAILYSDNGDGLSGVVIPGININASGSSDQETIDTACQVLQEVIDDLIADKEDVPRPVDIATLKPEDRGVVVILPAQLPGKQVRINVTLPEGLVSRIDKQAGNRSAFLAACALKELDSR